MTDSLNMIPASPSFLNKTVALAESRQLDVLATLIENRDGNVFRVPLVSIYDAPDPEPVLLWIRGFINQPPDLLVLYTGEGLRRLLKLANANGLQQEFVATLSRVQILVRGPKPDRELSLLGLKSTFQAQAPTTPGVIITLGGLPLSNRRIAVQLYGAEPNQVLMDFLSEQNAIVETVSPYVYADESEDEKVLNVITMMEQGQIDIFAFTSQPQLHRLMQVAKKYNMELKLRNSLNSILVAAVGPVVKEQLELKGIKVDIMPERQFFMKPLVTAMIKYLAANT